MAVITSLATLKTALEEYRDRTDTAFTNQEDSFVALCENRLNIHAAVRLNVVDDATLTGTIDSRDMALPSDFVEPIALFLTTYGTQDALAPIIGGNYELSLTSGTPEAYFINGSNITFDKPCDQAHTFTFRYRKKLFDLATTDPNWLLTNYPNVYLWGCLVEAAAFEREYGDATAYEGRFQEALNDVKWLEARGKALAPLRVDPAIGSVGSFNINSGDFGGVGR